MYPYNIPCTYVLCTRHTVEMGKRFLIIRNQYRFKKVEKSVRCMFFCSMRIGKKSELYTETTILKSTERRLLHDSVVKIVHVIINIIIIVQFDIATRDCRQSKRDRVDSAPLSRLDHNKLYSYYIPIICGLTANNAYRNHRVRVSRSAL